MVFFFLPPNTGAQNFCQDNWVHHATWLNISIEDKDFNCLHDGGLNIPILFPSPDSL